MESLSEAVPPWKRYASDHSDLHPPDSKRPQELFWAQHERRMARLSQQMAQEEHETMMVSERVFDSS